MYKISTIEKKNVIEKNFYVKDDLSFTIEQCYRWGYFTTSEKPDMENYDPEEGMMIYDNDVDDHSFDDGCWIDFIYDDEITEEEREKIEAAWDEDWYEGINELGWKEDDSEVWFYGELEVEDLPKHFEDDDLSDLDNIAEGTTRSHVIEDDEEE
jgi:hypothetical protein